MYQLCQTHFMNRKEGIAMNDGNESNNVYFSIIRQYITYKQSLGYKTKSVACYLKQFEMMVIERNENKVGITQELSDAWCKKRDNETDSTHYNRVSILAQFSSYLNDNGVRSYIPCLPKNVRNYTPYIFTQDELARIFIACDQLEVKGGYFRYTDASMPALLRLLYGTGIRVGEALALRNCDLDLKQKCLHVKDSKNGQERLIPMSDSLNEVCFQYNRFKDFFLGQQSDTAFFFTKRDGSQCSHSSVYEYYRRILYLAGIAHRGKGHGPRIHDFRHTFAVHALTRMVKSGSDMYCALPILSTYLGHKRLESTDQYLRLTADVFPELIGNMEIISSLVYPKPEVE